MTPAQCRAARALLGWSQSKLAATSGVAVSTIRNFERGHSAMMLANRRVIEQAFRRNGVRLIPRDGVRREEE
jgi:transcriptional regulator with XRE-family HTH domain